MRAVVGKTRYILGSVTVCSSQLKVKVKETVTNLERAGQATNVVRHGKVSKPDIIASVFSTVMCHYQVIVKRALLTGC